MAESTTTQPAASVGHLSVHLEGQHPPDVPFLFERTQKRFSGAMGFSLLAHGAAVLLVVLVIRYSPAGQMVSDAFHNPKDIVWLSQPGPGGGGGGGGNQSKEPPAKLELPKTVPTPVRQMVVPNLDKLEDPMVAPVKSLTDLVPGSADDGLSRGPGIGGGYGTGNGTGIGPGLGPGLGPGSGGGTGGGVYQPGSGVSLPVKLKEVKPQYTPDAMRAKIQGTVVLECVVMPDGTVGDIHVSRSLDSVFGLDNEAIKAARQWRFIPGTKSGQPVPVLVQIEMEFTLR
jgi:protein TonB